MPKKKTDPVRQLIADMLVHHCPKRVPVPDSPTACQQKLQRRCPAGHQWFVLQPDCHPSCPLHVRNLNAQCDARCQYIMKGVPAWVEHYQQLQRR